ncbi:RBMS1 protein, partial [Polypterus senegalus]
MGKVWQQQMYPQYAFYYPQYLQAKTDQRKFRLGTKTSLPVLEPRCHFWSQPHHLCFQPPRTSLLFPPSRYVTSISSPEDDTSGSRYVTSISSPQGRHFWFPSDDIISCFPSISAPCFLIAIVLFYGLICIP